MNKKVLILGANGMLGHTLLKYFSKISKYETFGLLRNKSKLINIKELCNQNNIIESNITDMNNLKNIVRNIKPDVVVNCIGIIKQDFSSDNPLISISVNSLFPHQLYEICQLNNSRLIHFSTDCVFSGRKGNYIESDYPDALDLYGRSKFLGEVKNSDAITLRTSIIGEELSSARGLLSWFLAQKEDIKGYKNAIFSGLTAFEIGRVIKDFIIPNNNLNGIYHLSSNPIDKFSLLSIIKEIYNKKIEIFPDSEYKIDRSLDSSRFQRDTGYRPTNWNLAIKNMKKFKEN